MEIKSKPILFSTPMVKAIFEGRKTQTRRVIKPQPEYIEASGRWKWDIPKSKINKGCCESVVTASREWWEYLTSNQFPYQIGQTLWVRETWRKITPYDSYTIPFRKHIEYKADVVSNDKNVKWKSSIFMPRWASRINLEVTNIRVEKLQDITCGDVVKEGYAGDMPMVNGIPWFIKLWDSINAKRGYDWESNPWVWVIEFKRIK